MAALRAQRAQESAVAVESHRAAAREASRKFREQNRLVLAEASRRRRAERKAVEVVEARRQLREAEGFQRLEELLWRIKVRQDDAAGPYQTPPEMPPTTTQHAASPENSQMGPGSLSTTSSSDIQGQQSTEASEPQSSIGDLDTPTSLQRGEQVTAMDFYTVSRSSLVLSYDIAYPGEPVHPLAGQRLYLVCGTNVKKPGAYASWPSASKQYKYVSGATLKGYRQYSELQHAWYARCDMGEHDHPTADVSGTATSNRIVPVMPSRLEARPSPPPRSLSPVTISSGSPSPVLSPPADLPPMDAPPAYTEFPEGLRVMISKSKSRKLRSGRAAAS
ncbi:hypothetical protein B0H15DRAFT_954487 [Mycena belliarum]|uniref:Uncharacterized protein n=1 Tax=Mycena belliarum TaxID=1033014 RepID=A0AAD6XH39_9AGAR|nr:hypothetical protein B0H15DRAFT_954487 [Mycena belliae]